MEWTENTEGEVTTIHLSGDIDLNQSPRLRGIFQDKTKAKAPALLLDFSQVRYIDSSGLATLVEYYQSSRPWSGRIVLAGLSPRVRSVFDLVRLTEIFQIFDTPDEARQSLTAGV
jgi:anti-sigma B factor antagonist